MEVHVYMEVHKRIRTTSLNFNGKVFINRLSELLLFSQQKELDGFVIADKL
jgi:hypothetical protein